MTGDDTVVEREKQIEEVLVAYGKMARAYGATPKFSRRQKKALRLWDEAEQIELHLAESLGIPAKAKRHFDDKLSDRAWVTNKAYLHGTTADFYWNVRCFFDRITKLRAKAKKLCPHVSAHYRTLTEPILPEEESPARRANARRHEAAELASPTPTEERKQAPTFHGLEPGQSYLLPSGKKVAAMLGRSNWFFLSDQKKPATVYWFDEDGSLFENHWDLAVNSPTGWKADDLKPTEDPDSRELTSIILQGDSESIEVRPGSTVLDKLTGKHELVLGISKSDRLSLSLNRGGPFPHQNERDELVLVIRLDCDHRNGYRYPSEVSPVFSP